MKYGPYWTGLQGKQLIRTESSINIHNNISTQTCGRRQPIVSQEIIKETTLRLWMENARRPLYGYLERVKPESLIFIELKRRKMSRTKHVITSEGSRADSAPWIKPS